MKLLVYISAAIICLVGIVVVVAGHDGGLVFSLTGVVMSLVANSIKEER